MIERLDPHPGVKWLDLACGTGAVAERGADVTGCYGPTRILAESLDDERSEDLRRSWVEFADSLSSNGGIEHRREYLLVLGTRR